MRLDFHAVGHDVFHLAPFLFHILHQSELGAASVQIVAFSGNMEVGVPLKVIGEETGSALQSHKVSAPGKHADFIFCQILSAAFQEAFCLSFKQRKGERGLGGIGLILCGSVGAEADGVAIVKDGETGHYGVQINDTKPLSGRIIN